jgi:hypothetical protein
MLEPDRAQLEIFIESLLRHAAPGNYLSLRSFFEHESRPLHIVPAQINGNLAAIADLGERIARQAANNDQAVVFCPPVATFYNARTAEEKDVAEGLVLSVECDTDPQQGRKRLEALLGPATVVTASGGRWRDPVSGTVFDKLHLHWRLAAPVKDKDAIARLKAARELAARLAGADTTGAPVSHCYRWPGSWHRKAEPRLCRIETTNPDCELQLEHALDILRKAAGEDKQPNVGTSPAGDRPRLEWTDAFRSILSGEGYHPALAPLASSFAALGAPEPIAENVLYALLANSNPVDPARLRRRDIEIRKLPETVRSGYRKFAAPTAIFDPWAEYNVPDFPIEILPPVAREFVNAQSIVMGCDPAGMAMSVLAALSGAVSHRFALRMMRHGSWWENPRVWALLAGDPSSKKTPIFNAATSPLEEYQHYIGQQYKERLRESEEKGAEKPNPPQRFVVFDTTIEKLGDILSRSADGLLVKRDEFSGWVGALEKYSSNKGSAADRGFWLKAFDGGPYSIDRISRGETLIDNLSVSLIGGIQPARLAELGGLTSDGLLQRFLPVVLKPSRLALDQPTDDEAYGRVVRALILARPERLILSDEALEVMHGLRQELHDLETATAGLANGLQGFVGKLAGYAGRLALLLHMAHDPERGQTYAVGAGTVESVRKLILNFIIPHAVLFYRIAGSVDGDWLKTLASWILTSGKTRVVASDLVKNVWSLRGLSVFDLNRRVSPLIAGGWLDPVEPGPSCRAWNVNPAVGDLFANRRQQESARKTALRESMTKIFKKKGQ